MVAPVGSTEMIRQAAAEEAVAHDEELQDGVERAMAYDSIAKSSA